MKTHRHIRTLATVALFALTGCGAQSAPSPTVAQAPPSASTSTSSLLQSMDRYAQCLRDHGVPLLNEVAADGGPQVDKNAAALDVVEAGTKACGALRPPSEALEATSAPDIEALRRYSACLREHGLVDYPDPDPRTGDIALPDALARSIKADPKAASAMEACRGITGGDQPGVVGG